ncbi:unnamed protein product [Medioppia subpectinata]|uniref:ABC transporter domain-containing protein n=1 Tax=Medioppia subpectinata TaxID=1979941 RepID=A0A7R9L0N6_9ACAR|nr:unnamed protein product [Medioppia subpectinata]CAG2112212.1 unnamed protein product [Medioppia subpectinata]
MTVLVLGATTLALMSGSDIGQYDDCISGVGVYTNNTCLEILDRDYQINRNFSWYSTSVFLITQNLLELIPTAIGASLTATIMFYTTDQYNDGNRFYMFLYTMQLCLHSTQGVAYMTVALFYRHRQVAFMVATNIFLIHALLCGYFVMLEDMYDIFQFLSNISQLKFTTSAIFTISEVVSEAGCHENINDIDDDMSDVSIDSQYHSLSGNEYNGYLSIAWIDLTLKVDKTLYSSEKLILRGVNGLFEFNSLNALMGPSGAGKTSLLRSLNGMYRHLMTKESKIYLSAFHTIRTCFIAQDQREHLITGLTVKQSLIYASKLKNSLKSRLNHEINVFQLMQELAITDIMGVNVEKCSSGQQKRIVMAMELTPDIKPNLICVDEPTSGVDSYSALLMIKCFKKLSQRHSLTIITSIHQPNLEILMLFDSLYVLAKGGLTVYSGPPKHLSLHLQQCNITYNREQIPIEVLMKIAAKGFTDQKVIELSDKTNENMRDNCRRLETQLKLHSNGISIKSKPFSIVNTYHLFNRSIANIFTYLWKQLVAEIIVMLILTYTVTLIFDFDFNHLSGCVPIAVNGSNGCRQTAQDMEDLKLSNYNIQLYAFLIASQFFYHLILSAMKMSSEIKLFMSEHRNFWYSAESFFVVKSVMDLIPLIIIVVSVVAVVDNYDKEHTYWSLLLAIGLSSMSFQSLGQMCGICFEDNGVLVSILLIPLLTSFANIVILVYDMNTFLVYMSQLDMFAAAMGYIRIWFNGSDRF